MKKDKSINEAVTPPLQQAFVQATPPVDWKKLREKFFRECVDFKYTGNGNRHLQVFVSPHNLFDWFERKLSNKTCENPCSQSDWKEGGMCDKYGCWCPTIEKL